MFFLALNLSIFKYILLLYLKDRFNKLKKVTQIILLLIFGQFFLVSCKHNSIQIDNCNFVQNNENTYIFNCEKRFDSSITYSDDDINNIAKDEIENAGKKLAMKNIKGFYYVKNLKAKIAPIENDNSSKIAFSGKLLIGDEGILSKYKNAIKVNDVK